MTNSKTAIKLALIGHPVRHSRSAKIFELLARELDCPIGYEAFDVLPGKLKVFLRGLKGLRGFNITIPHKQSVIPLLDSLTPEARAIGAVNVVRFSSAGLKGHNTDAAGFTDALSEAGIETSGEDVMIFGAGGAARAAAFALGSSGARSVRFVNRSPENAAAAVKALKKRFTRTVFEAGPLEPSFLWVNATPLGMEGFAARSPAPGQFECSAAFDMVYGGATPFLRQAGRSGVKACDGLSMLVFQALHAWEFWVEPLGPDRRRALAQELLKEL